ncbi:MAG: YciI family protein [Cyclobacteriaceae bacterium]
MFFLLTNSSLSAQSKSYVFVFLHKRTDKAELPKEQVDKIMEGHMANINKMAKEGHLLVAGPFEGGGGIFIFNSTSINEVTEWVKADPGIQANRWKVEMLLYTPRAGSVCAVMEPLEMTMYSFVRYIPNIAKFNVQEAPETFGKHDDYLKEIKRTGNVIAEGTFGENEGGILIIKGDLQPEVIEQDPAVREGLLELESKKLYVAKGAFCEK